MSLCRFSDSYRLAEGHGKTPQHKFDNYPMRKTKAKDFALASYEIMLDELNADMARPSSSSKSKVQVILKKNILKLIDKRNAEILAERLAEKAAICQLHRVSAKARTKTTAKSPKQTAKKTAKAPKQTAKTTAKAPKQTAKTTEVPK